MVLAMVMACPKRPTETNLVMPALVPKVTLCQGSWNTIWSCMAAVYLVSDFLLVAFRQDHLSSMFESLFNVALIHYLSKEMVAIFSDLIGR
ncbi:unnamed protein product [Periconia digitata]|uniref:Uncharacterized protein n=1 Tax=Periconia digitata TaxID=1303443 RepID=A0A9W4U4Y2_9PLEO|nr:unnamed protein product [Periconia digitata]